MLRLEGHEVHVRLGRRGSTRARGPAAARRSWCSTSACPSSMVAKWRGAFARKAGGAMRYWWRSPGWGQEVDRRRSREAGFDMHLVKPVDPHHLRDAGHARRFSGQSSRSAASAAFSVAAVGRKSLCIAGRQSPWRYMRSTVHGTRKRMPVSTTRTPTSCGSGDSYARHQVLLPGASAPSTASSER